MDTNQWQNPAHTACTAHIHTVSGKKHTEHYRLSLKESISNFNNFWYKHFWHNSASAVPEENRTNKI